MSTLAAVDSSSLRDVIVRWNEPLDGIRSDKPLVTLTLQNGTWLKQVSSWLSMSTQYEEDPATERTVTCPNSNLSERHFFSLQVANRPAQFILHSPDQHTLTIEPNKSRMVIDLNPNEAPTLSYFPDETTTLQSVQWAVSHAASVAYNLSSDVLQDSRSAALAAAGKVGRFLGKLADG